MNREVSYAPAPWDLRGSSYILVYRFPARFAESQTIEVPALAGRFAGGLGVVIIVDYRSGNAGPYRELLLIPGLFQHRGQKFYSVTRIDVTTQASLVNGRRNWGLPKRPAQAKFKRLQGDRENVRFLDAGKAYAGFTLRSLSFNLPGATAVIPPELRTLMQPWEDRLYFFAPSVAGRLSPVIVESAWADGDRFPDFTCGRLLMAFKLQDFRLHFPPAFIDSLHS